MKRSEMIKKATELFEQRSNAQQYPGYSHGELTKEYLSIFEELGMVPPALESYGVTTMTGELLGDLHDVYEWEKEVEYEEEPDYKKKSGAV